MNGQLRASQLDAERICALRRSTSGWQMSVREAPASCDPAGLFRLLLIVSPGAGTIRYLAPMADPIAPDHQLAAVQAAMLQTIGDLDPARPPRLLVDDAELAARLEEPLSHYGVGLVVQRELPAIDAVLAALAHRDRLFSDGSLLGTAIHERRLARAARDIAELQPWRRIVGELPLEVSALGSNAAPHVLALMGRGNEILSVAAYDDEHAYRHRDHRPALRWDERRDHRWCLWFVPAGEVPAEVRAAFARRGLPVAHEMYPRFGRLGPASQDGRDITSEADALRIATDLQLICRILREQPSAVLRASTGFPVPALLTRIAAVDYRVQPRPDLAAPADAARLAHEPWHTDSCLDLLDPGQEPVPDLLPIEHSMLVATVPASILRAQGATCLPNPCPALVVDTAPAHATRAIEALADVEALECREIEEGGCREEVILGYSSGRLLGTIARWSPQSAPLACRLGASTEAQEPVAAIVIACSGQPGRITQLRPSNVAAVVPVAVLTGPQRKPALA